MKKISLMNISGIFLILTSFSWSALASVQFTYTSEELPYLQGFTGGIPNPVGVDEPPYPFFSATFHGGHNDSITNFSSADLIWGTSQSQGLVENVEATEGSVTRNEDGSLAAWNFSLTFSESSPRTPDDPPSRTQWLFQSSYGAGTCNCDKYLYEWDTYTRRPYDTWQFSATLGVLYGNANDPGNWMVEEVKVPTPTGYLLVLTGLLIIGCARSSNRSCTFAHAIPLCRCGFFSKRTFRAFNKAAESSAFIVFAFCIAFFTFIAYLSIIFSRHLLFIKKLSYKTLSFQHPFINAGFSINHLIQQWDAHKVCASHCWR